MSLDEVFGKSLIQKIKEKFKGFICKLIGHKIGSFDNEHFYITDPLHCKRCHKRLPPPEIITIYTLFNEVLESAKQPLMFVETLKQSEPCRIECRHYPTAEDCLNCDGSFEVSDICPLDGERCISGLEPDCYDPTFYPTRIPKLPEIWKD